VQGRDRDAGNYNAPSARCAVAGPQVSKGITTCKNQSETRIDRRNVAPPDQQIQSVTRELRRISDLLALLITKDKTQAKQVRLLNAARYAAAEIATLLDTTPNTVSVTLSQQKAAKRSGAPRKRTVRKAPEH
jgi:hypothetical protein